MTLAQLVAPVLLGLVGWVPFAFALRRGRRVQAALVVVGWTIALMVLLPLLENAIPGTCSRLFPGAAHYGDGMVAWARSGIGCESHPACFVPQHAGHAAAFAVAATVSGGVLGLAFAALLFGWMGAYAAALGTASGQPVLASVLAWHPWAVVRVVAYVALGVALSEPLVRRGHPPLPGRTTWLLAGVLGLVLDVLLKIALAPTWWRLVIHPMLEG